jgi:hypothetical protein
MTGRCLAIDGEQKNPRQTKDSPDAEAGAASG